MALTLSLLWNISHSVDDGSVAPIQRMFTYMVAMLLIEGLLLMEASIGLTGDILRPLSKLSLSRALFQVHIYIHAYIYIYTAKSVYPKKFGNLKVRPGNSPVSLRRCVHGVIRLHK